MSKMIINLALQFADNILLMKDGEALSFEDIEKTIRSEDISLAFEMEVNAQMNLFYSRCEI